MSSTTSKFLPLEFWVGLCAPVMLVIWLVPAILLRAWVLTTLWQWYIVPAFGVPSIRMAVAFGLSIIVAAFVPSKAKKAKEDRSLAQMITGSFTGPLISLFLGWIGSFFV